MYIYTIVSRETIQYLCMYVNFVVSFIHRSHCLSPELSTVHIFVSRETLYETYQKTIWFYYIFKINNRVVVLVKRSSRAIVDTTTDQEPKQSSTENYTHTLTVFWLKKAVRYTMFHVKHSCGLCKLLVSQKIICYVCLNINLF